MLYIVLYICMYVNMYMVRRCAHQYQFYVAHESILMYLRILMVKTIYVKYNDSFLKSKLLNYSDYRYAVLLTEFWCLLRMY